MPPTTPKTDGSPPQKKLKQLSTLAHRPQVKLHEERTDDPLIHITGRLEPTGSGNRFKISGNWGLSKNDL